MKQLGDVLLERGLATPEQVYEASQEQRRVGRSMGRVLVDQGVLTESNLVAALAAQIGLDFIDLGDVLIDPSAVALVPGAVCRRHMLVPVRFVENKLVIAMADPANVIALDDVRTIAKVDLKPVVSTRGDVMAAIARAYRAGDELDSLSTAIEVRNPEEEEDLSRIREVVEDAPIVKFVNLLITQAIQDRASDIHIEPGENDLRVRFRIDGVLHEVMRSPKRSSRRDLPPEDHGRTSTSPNGACRRTAACRSTPTAARSTCASRPSPPCGARRSSCASWTTPRPCSTCRIWASRWQLRPLPDQLLEALRDDPGHRPDRFRQVDHALRAPCIEINKPEVNIITVEDPVEYRLPGINQVQVNPKAGLTFAAALRSILRSDPDVVLVGEIRDHETAQIAIEAALTGHLVLPTLHTNDAPSAVTRLTEMGIEPFLVGSALDCVLAQRLARRLCRKCKEAYTPTPRPSSPARGSRGALSEPVPDAVPGRGCTACATTGYKGRVALHEVMNVTEDIERLAVERASPRHRGDRAAEGMSPCATDGMAQGPRRGHLDRRDPPRRRVGRRSSGALVGHLRVSFSSTRAWTPMEHPDGPYALQPRRAEGTRETSRNARQQDAPRGSAAGEVAQQRRRMPSRRRPRARYPGGVGPAVRRHPRAGIRARPRGRHPYPVWRPRSPPGSCVAACSVVARRRLTPARTSCPCGLWIPDRRTARPCPGRPEPSARAGFEPDASGADVGLAPQMPVDAGSGTAYLRVACRSCQGLHRGRDPRNDLSPRARR